MSNAWRKEAIDRINADLNRSADTHLIRIPLPEGLDIDLYLKDESILPAASSIGWPAHYISTASAMDLFTKVRPLWRPPPEARPFLRRISPACWISLFIR